MQYVCVAFERLGNTLIQIDSSVVEAAWTCHIQIGVDSDKGYVPVEVVAFIAEACWARQVYNILRSFNSNVTIS